MEVYTVAIPNLDINVWTPKSELSQVNFLRSLLQPENIRQKLFELIDIEYNQVKYEIARMELVEYNTGVGRNVMNVDVI